MGGNPDSKNTVYRKHLPASINHIYERKTILCKTLWLAL